MMTEREIILLMVHDLHRRANELLNRAWSGKVAALASELRNVADKIYDEARKLPKSRELE